MSDSSDSDSGRPATSNKRPRPEPEFRASATKMATVEHFAHTATERGGVRKVSFPTFVFDACPSSVTLEMIKEGSTPLTFEHVTFSEGRHDGERWMDGFLVQDFTDKKQLKLASGSVNALWKAYATRSPERVEAYEAWSKLQHKRQAAEAKPSSAKAPVAEPSKKEKKDSATILDTFVAALPDFSRRLENPAASAEDRRRILRSLFRSATLACDAYGVVHGGN